MKILPLISVFLLLFPIVLGQTTEEDAGITPANPLFSLDRAIERLQVFLTKDTTDKIDLEIEFAQERVAEIIVMLQEKRDERFIELGRQAYGENIGNALTLRNTLNPEQRLSINENIKALISQNKNIVPEPIYYRVGIRYVEEDD